MKKEQATAVARAFGGEVWAHDDGEFVVGFELPDGRMVVLSHGGVAEYRDDDALDERKPTAAISFRADQADYWVVQDAEGRTHFADASTGSGWPSEYDADREARGLSSRTGVNAWARPQADAEPTRFEH